MNQEHWYKLKTPEHIISPSLLVYPERILQNIRTMIDMAGGTTNLRPHIKTHKCAEIIALQMEQGIHKFKCATIAEAELLASCNAPDVLLAMQPVGANLNRFVSLTKNFPDSQFSTLVDNKTTCDRIAAIAEKNNITIAVYIDLNVGMNRTGIVPSSEAIGLYKDISENSFLSIQGLHAYDGHIRNPDPASRKIACDTTFEKVEALKEQLLAAGLPKPIIIAGGSPSFPFHCRRNDVVKSPGTALLWDCGYGDLFPEMKFIPAAVLLTRILSKPKAGILCFDLGHKSIAPEMAFPRVKFLTLEHGKQIGQSEEHLVVEYDDLKVLEVGECHYAIPKHICPTVAKYDSLLVVEDGQVSKEWKVAARNQKISI
ncbi:D-TA family PLP-dependent enzyme [Maribacter sp. R77961]|uniref:D-TA family PLP-dependent enzyme n=1 Tax=Maribacter sp. R77961 TaxID=3093871 RepID=UPI0037C673DF